MINESRPAKYVRIPCCLPRRVKTLCLEDSRLPIKVISSRLNSSIKSTTFFIRFGESPFTSMLIAVSGNFSKIVFSRGIFPSSTPGFCLYESVVKWPSKVSLANERSLWFRVTYEKFVFVISSTYPVNRSKFASCETTTYSSLVI